MRITVSLPIQAVSEANIREHWGAKHRRAAAQREAAFLSLRRFRRGLRGQKLDVTLTRIGKRRLDDDNLARSLKAVRDGVADAIGVDDGSEWISWHYAQEMGGYAVRIEIGQRHDVLAVVMP